nr:hypothetical protein [Octadecabacter sp. SW4]
MEPVFFEPVFFDPVFVDPVFFDPVFVEPVFVDPVFVEPVYVEPVCVDPVFTELAVVTTVFFDPVFFEEIDIASPISNLEHTFRRPSPLHPRSNKGTTSDPDSSPAPQHAWIINLQTETKYREKNGRKKARRPIGNGFIQQIQRINQMPLLSEVRALHLT